MKIAINDLYLIIAQLHVDLNNYEYMHEQVAMAYGGGEEARETVDTEFLGAFMQELRRILNELEQEVLTMEEQKKQNEIHVS